MYNISSQLLLINVFIFDGVTMKKIISITLLAFLLTGCGEPKIDATSEESLKASAEKICNTLTPQKCTEFGNAMKIVMMSQFNAKELIQSGGKNYDSELEKKWQKTLNDKTADQVIKEATEIKTTHHMK